MNTAAAVYVVGMAAVVGVYSCLDDSYSTPLLKLALVVLFWPAMIPYLAVLMWFDRKA